MTDVDINIYVDATLEDVDDHASLIPTVVSFEYPTYSGASKIINYVRFVADQFGMTEFQVEHGFAELSQTLIDVDDEFRLRVENDATNNVDDELKYRSVLTNMEDTGHDVMISNDQVTYYNLPIDFYQKSSLNNFVQDIIDDFKIYFRIYLKYDIPTVIITASGTEHEVTLVDLFTSTATTSGNNDTIVDLSLINYVKTYYNTDIFSTVSGIIYGMLSDITTTSGRAWSVYTDLYSAFELPISGTLDGWLNNSIFSTVSESKYYISDVDVISGYIISILSDVYSATFDPYGNIPCDIRILSLMFGNFFLDIEEFTTTSATAWVDIIDYEYTIDTSISGSYFLVNGQQVDVTFSGIPYGQRMFYNPPDDFDAGGTLVYTAYATNFVGEYIQKSYYLLHGYNVKFDEYPVDWGYNKEVAIWAQATNLVFCPNTETDAFYFRTADLHSYNLGATIQAVESVDLNVTIYPQNTFFFYGRTYTIKISGIQDFAGNKMSDFNFSFIIENK